MKNTCNYSDHWQPYIKDYDKFEYDIMLSDERIVENCYPNAGEFNSLSSIYDGQRFHEDLVVGIRFSNNPKLWLNEGVSSIIQVESSIKSYIDFIEPIPYHALLAIPDLYGRKEFICKGKHQYREVKIDDGTKQWICQCERNIND